MSQTSTIEKRATTTLPDVPITQLRPPPTNLGKTIPHPGGPRMRFITSVLLLISILDLKYVTRCTFCTFTVVLG